MAIIFAAAAVLPLLVATLAAVAIAIIAARAPADRRQHLLAIFDRLVYLVTVLRGGSQHLPATPRRRNHGKVMASEEAP